MQEYQLAVLINVKESAQKMQKFIAKELANFKGKVLQVDISDVDLAYAIKKQNKAILLNFFIAIEVNQVLEFKKELEAEKEIIRFLIVKFSYTKIKRIKEEEMKIIEAKTKNEPKEKKETKKKAKKKVIKKSKSKKNLDKALEKILNE